MPPLPRQREIPFMSSSVRWLLLPEVAARRLSSTS